MSKKRLSKSGIVSAGMLTVFLLLAGCAGTRLYNEGSALGIAQVKTNYAEIDVLGVIAVEKQNLDNLLAEELKVVRDNKKLQVDFALLSIADDNTPMADTYTGEAIDRLDDLGYPNGFKELRAYLLDDVDLNYGDQEMKDFLNQMKVINVTPPRCRADKPLPETEAFIETLAEGQRVNARFFYEPYRTACNERIETLKNHRPGGLIGQAYNAWKAAEAALMARNRSIDSARVELKKIRDEHNQAIEAVQKAQGSGDSLAQHLRDVAAELLKAKAAVESLDPNFIHEERLDAIVNLLTATAGGEVNTSDRTIQNAATIAEQIPSLAGDIAGLLNTAKAPSVNNLLIEMRHQVLQLEYEKQLRTLAEQRVDIRKVKYDALQQEAEYWLEFGDAMCSFAALSAGETFPGQKCDDFSISVSSDDTTKVTCQLGDSPIQTCALAEPWNVNIQGSSETGATRELYKALAGYLRALRVQAKPAEQDFRLIDVLHRETLAARQSAIQSWNNLVAVPIDQLDAYYHSGLKPAEIADLFVKALGLTAIAIGASK